MKWCWQQKNWPDFIYDISKLKDLEALFVAEYSRLLGVSSIITETQQQTFTIELMSEEALKSSGLEGEMLDRDSVASSLLRQLGLAGEYSDHRANEKEKGIAALMVDNYQNYDLPLTHEMLFKWHPCVVAPSFVIRDVGKYRSSPEPMQIVSGYEGNYKVHYVAPPSARLQDEMDVFIQWYNDTGPGGSNPLPPLTRAGITHIYFEAIHPFDDGNGRIGRALSEKALAQSLGKPALLTLSHVIEQTKPEYYEQLEKSQKGLDINAWLSYFARTTLDAVAHSQHLIRFTVEKTRLFDRVRGQINARQEKAIVRMLTEGLNGFEGGMSAKKYMKITGAISRTASRDLQRLVELGVFTKTGQLKGTRYWISFQNSKT